MQLKHVFLSEQLKHVQTSWSSHIFEFFFQSGEWNKCEQLKSLTNKGADWEELFPILHVQIVELSCKIDVSFYSTVSNEALFAGTKNAPSLRTLIFENSFHHQQKIMSGNASESCIVISICIQRRAIILLSTSIDAKIWLTYLTAFA